MGYRTKRVGFIGDGASKLRLYNKCWGDTTTVSLPTLFFCKKISI